MASDCILYHDKFYDVITVTLKWQKYCIISFCETSEKSFIIHANFCIVHFQAYDSPQHLILNIVTYKYIKINFHRPPNGVTGFGTL